MSEKKQVAKVEGPITPLEMRFCEEYIIDRSPSKAMQRAHPTAKQPSRRGAELLLKPRVQRYIDELTEKIRKRNQIDTDTIIRDICEVRDRCMQRVPVMEFDREERCYVQSQNDEGQGVWTFDAGNALKACDMLAKHIGFYEADNKSLASNVNILNTPSIEDLVKIRRMLDES